MPWADDCLDFELPEAPAPGARPAPEDHEREAMLATLLAELEALPLERLRGRYFDFLHRRTREARGRA